MKRILLCLAVLAFVADVESTHAENSVVVSSLNVGGGEAGIEIPILLTNDVPLRTVILPVAIRSLSNGAFITSLAMSYGDRLPMNGPISEYAGRNQYNLENGHCKAQTPGGFGTIAFADGGPHAVTASPVAAMFSRVRIFGSNLDPGSDVTGSIILTVDCNLQQGRFEIDTTCTDPNNHIYFVRTDNTGIVPEFTKGLITIGQPPANYPPVVHDDTCAAFGNNPLIVDAPGVLANDTDTEGDPLTAELTAGVNHGSVVLNHDGSFIYTADRGFEGADEFSYRAFDGSDYSKSDARVTIRVLPIGPNIPEAVDDSFTVVLGFALDIPSPGVLLNDSDPNGDPLTAILAESPYHGTLALNADGSFHYVPTPNFTGQDRFTYYAFDGVLRSAQPALVQITVLPNSGRPIARDDHYFLYGSSVVAMYAPGVLSNDTEPFGLTLHAVLATDVQHGTLQLNSDGSFVYVTGPDYEVYDQFTYRAVSSSPISSLPATVTIMPGVQAFDPPDLTIHCDVRPAECPNMLHVFPKGGGDGRLLPVAILGMPGFDIGATDISSLRLEGCAPLSARIEDVTRLIPIGSTGCACTTAGPEGYPDLVLEFDEKEVADRLGPVKDGDEIVLNLSGEYVSGGLRLKLYGSDCVRISGPKITLIKTENRPNPFNGLTVISYALQQGGQVRLEVFDLLGRRLAKLVDEYQPAGIYHVDWHAQTDTGHELASGVYFYRVMVDDLSMARMIILLK